MSVKHGDTTCFEILHKRHRPHVVRLIDRITHDPAVAEELSQEIFLRVYMARERYQPSAAFNTWLYRIAFNRALNWLRSQGKRNKTLSYDAEPAAALRRALADPIPNPERMLLRQEQIGRIRKAVLALPARQREALMLHKFEGLGYAGIAVRLATTVPAVKSLLFRTYLALQSKLLPLSE